MKVKCRSCGRRFDYEDCGGMCPKCSAYYQIDIAPQEDMFGERFEGRNEYYVYEQESSAYEQKQSKGEAVYKKAEATVTNTRQRISSLTVCLVVLMIAVLAFPFVVLIGFEIKDEGDWGELAVNREEQLLDKPDSVQITSLQVGEAFSYDAVNTYNYEGREEHTLYNIHITGAQTDNALTEQMPEGYEMVAVSYEITEEGEKEDNEKENNFHKYSIYTNTYLLTKSGKYINPVENYHMEELLGCEYEELEQRGIDSEFSYSKGAIYFMVKKGDVAGLRIFCQQYDHESYQVTGISAGYEILGLGGGNHE